MLDGFSIIVMLFIPYCSFFMDGLDDAGVNFGKLTLQQIGEKIMVAIPGALIIQRNDEQVVPIQKIKHLLAVVLIEDPIAEGSAEMVEERGV